MHGAQFHSGVFIHTLKQFANDGKKHSVFLIYGSNLINCFLYSMFLSHAGIPVFQLLTRGQGALREQSRREIPNQTTAAPAAGPRQRGNITVALTLDVLVFGFTPGAL